MASTTEGPAAGGRTPAGGLWSRKYVCRTPRGPLGGPVCRDGAALGGCSHCRRPPWAPPRDCSALLGAVEDPSPLQQTPVSGRAGGLPVGCSAPGKGPPATEGAIGRRAPCRPCPDGGGGQAEGVAALAPGGVGGHNRKPCHRPAAAPTWPGSTSPPNPAPDFPGGAAGRAARPAGGPLPARREGPSERRRKGCAQQIYALSLTSGTTGVPQPLEARGSPWSMRSAS